MQVFHLIPAVLLLLLITQFDRSEGIFSFEYCPTEYVNSSKYCLYRDRYEPRRLWKPWISAFCYNYTNPYRLNFRYPLEYAYANCPATNDSKLVPITIIDNQTFFLYDHEDPTSIFYVRKSFKKDVYFDLWKDCCQQAIDCCDKFMTNEIIVPTNEYPCPATWDGWSCFPQAKANTTTRLPCSSQAYSSDAKVCVLKSEKQCLSNGWNQQTNYETCAIAPYLRDRHFFHVVFLIVGIVLEIPAVVIFFSFENLRRNLRLKLHRNLIIIIIIRSILTVMSKEIILLDALKTSESNNVMTENGVACRILAFFENAAKNGIYACMVVDGFYLHKIIARNFAQDPKESYLYAIVVVLSLVPSLIWGILRGTDGGDDCWMVDTVGDQWVCDGFRMFILAVNTLFLLDIIRVMVTRLKHVSHTQQARATFKATLFLIPLFGIHIIIVANRDILVSQTCTAEDVYYYISYSLEALQGILVSLLFCYLSNEVHKEISNAYRKFALYVQDKYGMQIRRETIFRRRTTAATYVGRRSSCTGENLNQSGNAIMTNESHI